MSSGIVKDTQEKRNTNQNVKRMMNKMGTNYYVELKPPCKCCGREYTPLHIGKSSGGWCFSVHVIPELGINNLQDWSQAWKGKRIYNEYHDDVSAEEMLDIITNRSWIKTRQWSFSDYIMNHAQPGPNGLVRHVVDDVYCVGHGVGTWDYITGDFS